METRQQFQECEMDEYNRQDDFLMDALEGIEEKEICLHTPDILEYLGEEKTNHGIIKHFKCSQCNKIVIEHYSYLDTVVQ